jgi:hypothetical protein
MRFPGRQKAERTAQEWERELMGMKLKVKELDSTVQVGGTPMFVHINFASKSLETAKLAKIDTTTSGIWQSCDVLPEVLREKVPLTQANWTTYTDAIKAVDHVHICKGVVKAKKAQEMERVTAFQGSLEPRVRRGCSADLGAAWPRHTLPRFTQGLLSVSHFICTHPCILAVVPILPQLAPILADLTC